ncbi:MAG: hypothetical protein HQ521_00620 [Bacteroidetes bacterium]|nr:hypothetical protein [Bacteroidota bacterium]
MKNTKRILVVLFSIFSIYSLHCLSSAQGFNPADNSELDFLQDTTVSVTIELSSEVPDWSTNPIMLKVIIGNYKLKSGATLRAGSQLTVKEDWMTFPTGLIINVEKGGIKLGGKLYQEGKKLKVGNEGVLLLLKDN